MTPSMELAKKYMKAMEAVRILASLEGDTFWLAEFDHPEDQEAIHAAREVLFALQRA